MSLDIPFDNSFARLPDRFYARLDPKPVARPELVALNDALAVELGIQPSALRSPAGVDILSGNTVAQGSEPLAQAYAGHQFGGWVPQLGDGRAHLLGEVTDAHGRRRDIQLKGSGRTPFSRNGDGRAWLGPVLREFLVSEAMHALGVPTSRALAAVTTGEIVQREKAYPGAVLTRVASSHIRVGTFQYFAARRDTDALRALLDFAIERHYPDIAGAEDPALAFFFEVIAAQARLVAHWMGLGFIHGVMNTDNTTVSGETIDYGPCAFIDGFHPDTVFSSIDAHGRYAYKNQADIMIWNLAQLGGALLPLMDGAEDHAAERATRELRRFPELYQVAWLDIFAAKIGIDAPRTEDTELIGGLLALMARSRADFTNTFRGLADGSAQAGFDDPTDFLEWRDRWHDRCDGRINSDLLRRSNPAAIPRNHRVEEVIQAAIRGDYGPFENLRRIMATPFELADGDTGYANPPAPDEVVTETFCGT